MRVRLAVEDHGERVERERIRDALLVRRRFDVRSIGNGVLAAERPRGAGDVAALGDRRAGIQAARDLDDRELAHAVAEEIRLRVEEDRSPDLVLPVVVVDEATERRLDPAEHHRHARVRVLATVRVRDARSIGPHPSATAGRVRVVRTDASRRRVVVDHRVHVARGHPEEEPRATECPKRVGTVDGRLRDHADGESMRFQPTADEGHPEAVVIDVGVAAHEDHVELAVPGFFGRHGEELRHAAA